MKETALQSWVIDVVRSHGGAAYKLSHAYSTGVSDLLIKLPSCVKRPYEHFVKAKKAGLVVSEFMNLIAPAMLVEVKQKYGTRDDKREFKLDVTAPQYNFMRDFQNAGMRVGVLSFLQQGKIKLSAAIFELDALKNTVYYVKPADHYWLGKGPEQQSEAMYEHLRGFAK